MYDDLLYIIALMNIKGIGSIYARYLMREFGSAKAVFESDKSLLANIPRIGQSLIENIHNDSLFDKAHKEIEFIEQHHVKALIYGQEGYPSQLLDCDDAPTLLFYMGNAPLNSSHLVSIVGTRTCSQYGRDMVTKFVKDLYDALPDVIIVSGLALGIDISAHKAALSADAPTIGVMAHGLDRIYPHIHRNIAKEMVAKGGLITEYTTGTTPERGNFIARNRIIAGLSQATIIAESADKGGSIVTANIAESYGRDVFAFPGRSTDTRSLGCNRLIRLNRAGLINDATDFLESMNWFPKGKIPHSIQQEIPFITLTDLGQQIYKLLQDKGSLTIGAIAQQLMCEIPILTEELLELEMDDIISNSPGGLYSLK